MVKEMKKYIAFILLLFSVSSLSAATPASVFFEQGKLVVQAKERKLGEILREISSECQIEIAGLESREEEVITFSARGESPHEVLKRLFRYLGEKNCAFEFSDVKLTRVSILPASKGRKKSASVRKPERNNEKAKVSVVEIKGVEEGSQAETLDLQIGDFVTEYNGIRITNARKLVSEVKKRPDTETVEMTVVREGQPMQLVLRGGLIGIRIVTRRVPKSEVNF